MDFRRSLVAVAIILLTLMLLGGFYAQNLAFKLDPVGRVPLLHYLLLRSSSQQITISGTIVTNHLKAVL